MWEKQVLAEWSQEAWSPAGQGWQGRRPLYLRSVAFTQTTDSHSNLRASVFPCQGGWNQVAVPKQGPAGKDQVSSPHSEKGGQAPSLVPLTRSRAVQGLNA